MRFIYIQKRKNIWWLGGMGVILRMSSGTVSPTLICRVKHEGHVWIGLKTQRLRLVFFFFSFFFAYICETCSYCLYTVQSWIFFSLFNPSVHTVHCLWTHKFYFSATFLLKMSLTVLFTHLKIILLQCFSFSVFSCIQTDLRLRLFY